MSDRIERKPRRRRRVERILRAREPGVEAWAYGSRVKGRSRSGSDLDLALRGPGLRPIPDGVLRGLRKMFHDSTIPFFVEVRDWARPPESLHEEIERDHVVMVAPE